MFSQLSNNSKAILLAITGFGAFSIADASAKYLAMHYPVMQVTGTIAIFSTALALALSPLLGGLSRTLKTRKLKIHIARGLLNTIISLLVVTAFAKLSLALIYTLIFIAPFLTTLFAIPVYKEKVHKHGWIAIAAGFIGVLIVVRPGFAEINPWIFMPVVAAFFISCLFLLARALTEQETLVSLCLFPVCSNLLWVTPFALTVYGLPDPAHLPVFLLSGVTVVTGLICTATAFRIGKASLVSPFLYLQLIWGVIFGYFLFGDMPDLWTLAGAAIIIASGIYLIETERRIAKTLRIP